MFTVEQAKEELTKKPIDVIQKETAYKWASRSLAAFSLYRETKSIDWAFDAMEYLHEAVEHAAAIGDGTLTDILKTVGPVHRSVERDIKVRLPKVRMK